MSRLEEVAESTLGQPASDRTRLVARLLEGLDVGADDLVQGRPLRLPAAISGRQGRRGGPGVALIDHRRQGVAQAGWALVPVWSMSATVISHWNAQAGTKQADKKIIWNAISG